MIRMTRNAFDLDTSVKPLSTSCGAQTCPPILNIIACILYAYCFWWTLKWCFPGENRSWGSCATWQNQARIDRIAENLLVTHKFRGWRQRSLSVLHSCPLSCEQSSWICYVTAECARGPMSTILRPWMSGAEPRARKRRARSRWIRIQALGPTCHPRRLQTSIKISKKYTLAPSERDVWLSKTPIE
jgi:hypothetical protein